MSPRTRAAAPPYRDAMADTTGEIGSQATNDHQRLIAFLHGRDVPCPLCGYNLRDLTTPTNTTPTNTPTKPTRPVCPECNHDLELTVGVDGLRIGLFVATLAPFMSAGLAAIALGTMVTLGELTRGQQGGGPPPIFHLVTLLGLGSGSIALAIFWKRRPFLALPPAAQRRLAMIAWTLHLLPFLGLVILFLATS